MKPNVRIDIDTAKAVDDVSDLKKAIKAERVADRLERAADEMARFAKRVQDDPHCLKLLNVRTEPFHLVCPCGEVYELDGSPDGRIVRWWEEHQTRMKDDEA